MSLLKELIKDRKKTKTLFTADSPKSSLLREIAQDKRDFRQQLQTFSREEAIARQTSEFIASEPEPQTGTPTVPEDIIPRLGRIDQPSSEELSEQIGTSLGNIEDQFTRLGDVPVPEPQVEPTGRPILPTGNLLQDMLNERKQLDEQPDLGLPSDGKESDLEEIATTDQPVIQSGNVLTAFGSGLLRGVTTDLPDMVGRALSFVGIKSAGESLTKWAEARSKEMWKGDVEFTGFAKWVHMAGTMLPTSAIPGGVAMIGAKIALKVGKLGKFVSGTTKIINAQAGAAQGARSIGLAAKGARHVKIAKGIGRGKHFKAAKAALKKANKRVNLITAGTVGSLFGLAQAESTKEATLDRIDLLESQGRTEEANALKRHIWSISLATGAIEGMGETIGTFYLAKLFNVPVGQIAARTTRKFVIDYLVRVGKTIPVEVGTEIGQQVGEIGVEKITGVRPEAKIFEGLVDTMGAVTLMTLIMGGAGGISNFSAVKENIERDKSREGFRKDLEELAVVRRNNIASILNIPNEEVTQENASEMLANIKWKPGIDGEEELVRLMFAEDQQATAEIVRGNIERITNKELRDLEDQPVADSLDDRIQKGITEGKLRATSRKAEKGLPKGKVSLVQEGQDAPKGKIDDVKQRTEVDIVNEYEMLLPLLTPSGDKQPKIRIRLKEDMGNIRLNIPKTAGGLTVDGTNRIIVFRRKDGSPVFLDEFEYIVAHEVGHVTNPGIHDAKNWKSAIQITKTGKARIVTPKTESLEIGTSAKEAVLAAKMIRSFWKKPPIGHTHWHKGLALEAIENGFVVQDPSLGWTQETFGQEAIADAWAVKQAGGVLEANARRDNPEGMRLADQLFKDSPSIEQVRDRIAAITKKPKFKKKAKATTKLTKAEFFAKFPEFADLGTELTELGREIEAEVEAEKKAKAKAAKAAKALVSEKANEISSFSGENTFLSNFATSPMVFKGKQFPTLEHAYQTEKSTSIKERKAIREASTPGKAKRLGRAAKSKRPDFDKNKEALMLKLLRIKFKKGSLLASELIATGNAHLVEGNRHHDNFFGDCKGAECAKIEGQNKLGKLLMKVRGEIRPTAKVAKKPAKRAKKISPIKKGDIIGTQPNLQFFAKQTPTEKKVGKIDEKIVEAAGKEFGFTEDPVEAGFIMPDGRMLDFRRSSNTKYIQHHEVSRLKGIEGKTEFQIVSDFQLKTGAVRLFNSRGKPGTAQVSTLGITFTENQIVDSRIWTQLAIEAKDLDVGAIGIIMEVLDFDGIPVFPKGGMAKAPKIPNTGRARLLAKPFTKELIDPSAPPVESVKTINEKVLDIDESKDEDLTDGGKINSSNPKGLPGVGKGKRGTKERKGRGEDKVEAAPASGDVRQHQMGATPEQQAALQGYIKVFKLNVFEPETVGGWMQAAKEMGMDLPQLLKSTSNPKNLLSKEQIIALTGSINDTAVRMEKARKKFNQYEKTDLAKARAWDEAFKKEELILKNLLSNQINGLTEVARSMRAAQLIARFNNLDPAFWLRRAQQVLGKKITDARLAEINAEIQRISEEGTPLDMAEFVEGLKKPSTIQKLIALWKAGLLTAFKTHTANMTGTGIMSVLETTSDIPATGLDIIVSKFTGKRTVTISKRTVLAKLKAIGIKVKFVNGVPKFTLTEKGALKTAGRFFKTGIYSDELLDKYDLPRSIEFEKFTFLNTYMKAVFRSLGAEDIFFREIAMMESLEKQAIVIAKNRVLRGSLQKENMNRLIGEILQNPTIEMQKQAINTAARVTFQNPNTVSEMITRAKSVSKKKENQFETESKRFKAELIASAIDIVAPFVRTPTNIAFRILDLSPVGFAKVAIRATRPSIRQSLMEAETRGEPGLQQMVIQDIARGVTGTSIIAVGFMLASSGLMVGNAPEDQGERDQFFLEGKKPNSILLGGAWRSMNRISPFGNLLGVGAELYDNWAEGKDILGLSVSTGLDAAKMISEQTFLQGVSGVLKALNDPDRFGDAYANRMVGSMIPSIFGTAARVVDPFQRVPEKGLFGLVQSFASRLPWASKLVSLRVDAFGNPVVFPSAHSKSIFARAIQLAVDPIPGSKALQHPLLDEAKRIGVNIDVPSKTISGIRLTNAEWEKFQKLQGTALEKYLTYTVRTNQYQRAGILQQAKIWEKAEQAIASQHNAIAFPLLMINRYNLDKRFAGKANAEDPYFKAIRKVLKALGSEPRFKNASTAKQRVSVIKGLRQLGINHPN
tara:strand:- start:441 stop:7091 length:6651 start_codon:yes stop_codon:yes gene_type:complete